MQAVCRLFRNHLAFKSLVSVKFIGNAVISQGTLLQSCVQLSRKITKMTIEEVIIDMPYVVALERVLQINSNQTN